ncbi:hypothetical protein [Halovivax limisalsi]|uniref:hypothetical protein n=1 Tax=Halovivax limisalsi TaxID=1453760 RepID=UPI001FFC82FC|nr:hypothetical protein [Halovivax limisalsi]
MPTLSLELDEETLETLEVERSLIGFESTAAYVRWLLAQRATVDGDADTGTVLSAYSDRIADLEARLSAIETQAGPDDTESADPERSPSDADSTAVDAGATADGPSTDSPAGSSAADSESTRRRTTADGGWTTVADPASSDAASVEPSRPDPASATTAVDESRSSVSDEAGISSMNLRPERIERIRDERLSDDAGELGSVETDRVDELSRRAVAKTRERLDRDVETGLEYRSATSLADTNGDIRPGEDVADLDALDVPGRSADLVERRQELIGVALAHLRDAGSAKKGDFVDALYEEYPAGYGSPGGWWRCLKTGLKQVDRVDGGDGSRIWRLTD